MVIDHIFIFYTVMSPISKSFNETKALFKFATIQKNKNF